MKDVTQKLFEGADARALTQGELRLLLELGLIEARGKTADGQVTSYALTGAGRILVGRSN